MEPVSASAVAARGIMEFQPISPIGEAAPAQGGSAVFDAVVRGVEQADSTQKAATALQDAFAMGKDVPVHTVMAATQKASLTMEMMVALRNRALEAYQEVMKMQA